MRKRNLIALLDHLFWFILLLLPLISYLIYCGTYAEGVTVDFTFNTFLTTFFELQPSRFIYNIFDWFNTNISDIFTISTNGWLNCYLSYMILLSFAHLFIDALLFIFKWAQSKLSKGVID